MATEPRVGGSPQRRARRRGGEIIWFLDDDLVPAPGLVLRHRAEHQQGAAHLLLGPCKPLPSTRASEHWVEWWGRPGFAELEQAGFVDRFDRFTVANLSGPTEWFRLAGGFDPNFTGYGFEDYELGFRMLRDGVVVRFDPEAAGGMTTVKAKVWPSPATGALHGTWFGWPHCIPRRSRSCFRKSSPTGPCAACTALAAARRCSSTAVSRLAAAAGIRGWIVPKRYAPSLRKLAEAASFAAGSLRRIPDSSRSY